MPQIELVAAVAVAAVLLNVVLAVTLLALGVRRSRRRESPLAEAGAAPPAGPEEVGWEQVVGTRTPVVLAGPGSEAGQRAVTRWSAAAPPAPTPPPAASEEDERGAAAAEPEGEGWHAALEPGGPPLARSVEDEGWTDLLTGLDSRTAWERALREEAARFARYGRPVTVVYLELDGLRELVERVGHNEADRFVRAVADSMRRSARTADRLARVATGRFLALLPETDEVQAIHFIDRLRDACDPWLVAAPNPLRLFVGWANPAPGGDLQATVRAAEERMYVERRRTLREEAAATLAEAQVGAAAEPASGEPAPARAERGVHEALAELEEIRRAGLISEREYRAKRGEVISRL